MITRDDIRKVSCPFCKAKPGFLCTAKNGDRRVSSHLARLKLYKVKLMLNKPKKIKIARRVTKHTPSRPPVKKPSASGRGRGVNKNTGTPRFDDGNIVVEKF